MPPKQANLDPVELSQALIRCPSVTPKEAGVLKVLEKALTKLGFACERVTFKEKGTPDVENLYARFGTSGSNLCFAGHVDVVPPGDTSRWDVDPFAAEIRDGVLIGRGASDMKCAVACWVAAISEFLQGNETGLVKPASPELASSEGLVNPSGRQFNKSGSLSLLITCDEEGPSINGTKKMLGWLKEKGEIIDACIVGEPTNPTTLGEMAKIGRRGSMDFTLTVKGVQGHIAYPEKARNPVNELVNILQALKAASLDGGTAYFPPSNLEISTVDVGNPTRNIIPASARAEFNIRFNDTQSETFLAGWVKQLCEVHAKEFTLEHRCGANAFLSTPGTLADCVVTAVKKITGITTALSTTGGTSDARFIKDICPVVEFGGINETAHKINEQMRVDDIYALKNIYREIIAAYFTA